MAPILASTFFFFLSHCFQILFSAHLTNVNFFDLSVFILLHLAAWVVVRDSNVSVISTKKKINIPLMMDEILKSIRNAINMHANTDKFCDITQYCAPNLFSTIKFSYPLDLSIFQSQIHGHGAEQQTWTLIWVINKIIINFLLINELRTSFFKFIFPKKCNLGKINNSSSHLGSRASERSSVHVSRV